MSQEGKPDRETVLEVGAEGGSLSILRTRVSNREWRFVVIREESALADLLTEEDQLGSSVRGKSESVETFAEALMLMSHYSWHSGLPLKLHADYAETVMKEVSRRGRPEDEKRWRSALSHRALNH